MISKTEQNKTTSWISNLCDARYVWKTDRCVTLMLNEMLVCAHIHTKTHFSLFFFFALCQALKSKTYKCSKIFHQILGLMWLMPDAFIKSTFNHHHHQHFLLVFKIPFLSQFTFDIYVQNTIIIITHTHIAHMAADSQSTIHTTGEFKCRKSEIKRIFKKWKECECVDFQLHLSQ